MIFAKVEMNYVDYLKFSHETIESDDSPWSFLAYNIALCS